jgi:hypothetical protein
LPVESPPFGAVVRLAGLTFFRHLRFVNDQQQRLKRVVLAGDSGVTSLAPQLAAHFVNAEVKTFEYDELDSAVAWARGRQAAARRSAYPDTTAGPG